MARTKQTARRSVGGKAPRTQIAAITSGKSIPSAKEKRRWRPGTVAMRQIKKYQKSVELLIPRRCMLRLIKEIIQQFSADLRIQASAVEALREAAEMNMILLFEIANTLAVHTGRVTIQPKDLKLAVQHSRMLGLSMWAEMS